MQKSPFKFLDSYSKEDRNIFFGRDKEIEELYSRTFESKILIVYGISGTGKSSLINCGLANKFNDSDWLPINVRRGQDINKSLSDSLLRSSFSEPSSEKVSARLNKKPDIVRLIRSIYLDHFKPVFLIFDQFEELFIFGNKNEKDELISSIKKVLDSDLQCRFIFSIREEYLAGITEFERTIPSILSNRVRIEKMTRLNAIQVIEGPCRVNSIEVEPLFSEKLIQKLNPDNPEVELTYLQVYLDKVFHLAINSGKEVNTLTLDLLKKAGDVKDLLGTFLEEQITRLDDPDAGLVVLKSFVSVNGTKHQIAEDEVIEYSKTLGKDIGRDNAKSLIQKFIRLRILRDKDENGRYELRHDSLASKIYEKITLVEKELLEIRQFIENAFNNFEKRELYLSPEDLKYIAPYEDKLFLNDKISKFIGQSKWEIHRAKRRRQNVLISFAAILISVLSFFTIWAMKEKSNALQQKQFADEQKNTAVIARVAADSARIEAIKSKNLAIEKENQAVLAQKQSDQARREALLEREYALAQKNLAEKLSVTANQQALIANEEKQRAEQERSKAIIAEEKAKRLSMLSTAQNLALKSASFEKQPEIMGLFAVQSYNFNKFYGGEAGDPTIWEALNNAWTNLDSARQSVFTGSPNEIRTVSSFEGNLITADLDGQMRSWSEEGVCKSSGSVPSGSAINFIKFIPAGEGFITQHDNLNLILWNTKSLATGNPESQQLEGHHGFIHNICFSNDRKYMATAGSDSLIIIWDLSVHPVAKLKAMQTTSEVIAVTFCGADSIISSAEDGRLLLWNLKQADSHDLINSDFKKFLALSYDFINKTLYCGSADGSLVLLKPEKPSQFPVMITPNTAGIDILTFNSDFSLLATSGWDKTVRIYNCNEYFNRGNIVGGVISIKNLDSRIRSLFFTNYGKLVAGLSDNTIRLWEISSDRLAKMICDLIRRDMTPEEWNSYIGSEIPYEKTCGKNP